VSNKERWTRYWRREKGKDKRKGEKRCHHLQQDLLHCFN